MLKYIVIELCDTSTSYCHYSNYCDTPELISIDNLKAAILFAMKQNLNIQFVYPDYNLPKEYHEAINSIDHVKIKSSNASNISDADIIVHNGLNTITDFNWTKGSVHVLRISKADMGNIPELVDKTKDIIARLNIVITDIDRFTDPDFVDYKNILQKLENPIADSLTKNNILLNLLTDRIILDKMNNCNAGYETICVAPNGKFYVCPAFYHDTPKKSCGDLANGLNVKNPQLYRLDHAPICRHCDAYQCKRCVWLNNKTTFEINTPSHEQCVTAHLERNSSRHIAEILKNKYSADVQTIKDIDYLDPFDKREEW